MPPQTNSNQLSKCVIVVPCYNEAERLDTSEFQHYVKECEFHCQFLFVNDGSTDDTQAILDKLSEQNPEQFRVLSLTQNSGKAEAVRQGLCLALKDQPHVVGFWDADLATPLVGIEMMREIFFQHPKIQIVFGSRVKLLGRSIERRPIRHVLGRAFATIASLLLKLPVYDTQCGAKLFLVNPMLGEILSEPFHSRWVFDVEIIARAIQQTTGGAKSIVGMIYEYPLPAWRDVQGSKVKPMDFFRAIYELGAIYWKYLRRGSRSEHFHAAATRRD